MSHHDRETIKLLQRVRKLRGQLDAVERSLNSDADCGDQLMLLAAVRGGVAGLSGFEQNAIIPNHLPGPMVPTPAPAAHQGATKAAMTEEEEHELRVQLARLQQEHRDLDAAIAALQHSPGSDIIQVQRLKKRKLQLRDRITFIEDQLTPDIIA